MTVKGAQQADLQTQITVLQSQNSRVNQKRPLRGECSCLNFFYLFILRLTEHACLQRLLYLHTHDTVDFLHLTSRNTRSHTAHHSPDRADQCSAA